MSLGLCLSGGGIKGAAHIGALQAIEDNKLSIEYISGTSSGSIVATLYAIGYTPSEIYTFFKKYAREITHISVKEIIKLIAGLLFRHKVIINGLNNGKKFERIISKVCADKGVYTINQIKFPLAIPSVNLKTGETYIFTSQNVRSTYEDNYIYDNSVLVSKAVRSSCSFPGIYSPCFYKDSPLVDGGIRENIPWKELKNMGADKVISILFEKELKKDSFFDIFEVITKSIDLLSHELAMHEQIGSDYIIKINTQDTSLLDFSKVDFLYDLGYSNMNEFLKGNCNF